MMQINSFINWHLETRGVFNVTSLKLRLDEAKFKQVIKERKKGGSLISQFAKLKRRDFIFTVCKTETR